MNPPMTVLVTAFAVGLPMAATASGPERGDMFRGSQAVGDADGRATMNLATLRGCVALEYELRDLRSRNDSARISLEVAEGRMRAIDQWVQVMKQGLDLHDARAVDDYNGKLAEQARLTDDYNARVDPYNRDLEAIDAAVERFNADCTLPYRESDMRTVRSEREAALRAAMKARDATGER
ncbi:MAG: hypothetical protein J0L88_04270 [Xanthomonadales bacterium]|nr:hypothetical protein [Xanthomonadales bacterium]